MRRSDPRRQCSQVWMFAGERTGNLTGVVTTDMARSVRAGSVLMDVRQNAQRLTTIVPYSMRSSRYRSQPRP